MPFDMMPEGRREDIVALRTALEGIEGRWTTGELGRGEEHCLVGWLLEATGGDEVRTVRLAVDYVWPALPPSKRGKGEILQHIMAYNDRHCHESVVGVMRRAVELAAAV